MGKGELSDLERGRLGEDLYQHPLRPQMIAMNPSDGLPQVTSTLSMEATRAPSLSPDTFVCMADESQWVVDHSLPEVWFVLDASELAHVTEHPRTGERTIAIDHLNQEHADMCRKLSEHYVKPQALHVTPIRQQCYHYKRVMTDFEGQSDIRSVERSCAAQRTDGGEYVALRDTRVYACEHRVPRDFVSEKRLRRFDEQRIAENKRSEEEFDVEGELAALKAPTGETNG